ncbi:Elicitin [Phytophthora cactorum]|nr:Elicitin [Phytophthora cactorum]
MQFGIFFFFLLTAFGAVAEDARPPTEIKGSSCFSIAPPKGYPTDAQAKAMCASDECHALIEDVLALKPVDCYLSFAGYSKPSEGDKGHLTPKPTDEKHYSTPKPKDHHTLDEPMIIKNDHEDKHFPTHCTENKKAKDADNLKSPMNGTAIELFPMPNTAYKATASPQA